MTYTQWLTLLVFPIGVLYCSKEEKVGPTEIDTQGVIVHKEPVWRLATTRGNDELNYTIVRQNVMYDGAVIIPIDSGKKPSIAMVSARDGSMLWQWSDLLDVDKDFLSLDNSYQWGSKLIFPLGTRLYGVDLVSGHTLFRLTTEDTFNRITGIGNRYFLSSVVESAGPRYYGAVYSGTFDRGNYEPLLIPPYSDTSRAVWLGQVGPVIPYLSESGNQMLSFYYDDVGEDYSTIYRALYNYSQRETVYDDKVSIPTTDFGANGQHLVHGNIGVMGLAKKLIAFELTCGELLWEQEFTNTFTFSGYIATDGMILANNEDTYLYAFDASNGELRWKVKSSGTSSKMEVLNGIVYFVGGGDGLLHAVEVATGEHLWRLKSPDLDLHPGAFFMPRVSVVPGTDINSKGRIIVSSYLSAVAYEAIR